MNPMCEPVCRLCRRKTANAWVQVSRECSTGWKLSKNMTGEGGRLLDENLGETVKVQKRLSRLQRKSWQQRDCRNTQWWAVAWKFDAKETWLEHLTTWCIWIYSGWAEETSGAKHETNLLRVVRNQPVWKERCQELVRREELKWF